MNVVAAEHVEPEQPQVSAIDEQIDGTAELDSVQA